MSVIVLDLFGDSEDTGVEKPTETCKKEILPTLEDLLRMPQLQLVVNED